MYACNGLTFPVREDAFAHARALHERSGVIAAVEHVNMLPQSQDEQERDRSHLAALLSCTRFTVERCTHESNERSALWIMLGARQIGVIARRQTTGDHPWYAQKMIAGQPVTELSFKTLAEAAAYAVRCFGD